MNDISTRIQIREARNRNAKNHIVRSRDLPKFGCSSDSSSSGETNKKSIQVSILIADYESVKELLKYPIVVTIITSGGNIDVGSDRYPVRASIKQQDIRSVQITFNCTEIA